MLTGLAIAKAATIPVALTLVLIALMRRSASVWCVLAAFLAGMLGAFSLHSAGLRDLPSMLPPDQILAATSQQAWLSGFIEAAIPEELAKAAWMLVFLAGWRRYSESHGALIGGLIGLGFALRENLGFAQTVPEWRVMAAFSHGAWGIITGSLLQRAVVDLKWRWTALLWGLTPTILLHGLLDTSMFLVDASESQQGIDASMTDPPATVGPTVIVEMAATFAVEALSLAWAIIIIRRLRRERGGLTATPAIGGRESQLWTRKSR